MKKSFSYPLPDELYVESFELGKKFSAEYDGPEILKVLINKMSGEIQGVDPESYDPVYFDVVEVDSRKTPEVSFYILNPTFEHLYEYVEETLVNGDIYKNITNPTLRDAYNLYYDFHKSKFVFDLIVKTCPENYLTGQLFAIRSRFHFIKTNEEGKKEKNEDLSISEETLNSISDLIQVIDKCIDENVMFMGWKYTNFSNILESVIKIPKQLKDLLNTYH
jgi:hypothetical protein